MTPREYANRLVVDLSEARTLTERVEAIARAIAEAVAEERESCALLADRIARQCAMEDDAGAACQEIAGLIRRRAGTAMAARRVS